MLKNIIANLVGRLWGTISNFLFIPLYIHYLGFESYSIISFTLIVAGLMAIIDTGVTATLSRELARLDKKHDVKFRIFRSLESIFFCIVLLCVILVCIYADEIALNWVNTKSFSFVEVTFFLKIIAIDVGFQLLLRFYMGGMFGLERQIKANVFQIAWGVLRNGGVLMVIFITPSLELFFIWQAAWSIIFAIFARFSLYKLLLGRYFYFTLKFEVKVLGDVWHFAGGMFLISLVAGINSQLDKLIISILFPIEILGYYTLSVSLAIGLVMLVSPISTALLPHFTSLYSSDNADKASKLFESVILFVSILIFSFMSNMVVNSKTILWMWTGDIHMAEQASLYFPIIVFSYAMLSLQIIPFAIVVANGYTKINNVLGLCSLVLTLPGYWWGVKFYGPIGAAIVNCIAQTTIAFIYFYFVNKKFIKKITIRALYLSNIIYPLIITLSIAYTFSFTDEWLKLNRLLSFFQIAFEVVITFVLTTFILMPKNALRVFYKVKMLFLR
jgi:O-antigen/teichoic acid export membrane protein